MKLNFKKIGVEAEANVENIIEKSIDNHEKDWKDKLETKHKIKKEILELKHKHKIEEQELNNKKNINFSIIKKKEEIELEKERLKLEQEKVVELKKEKRTKKLILIFSIILFFIYGMFCITGFDNSHIIASAISIIQMLLLIVSIFSSINLFSLFKNDYKVCFITSILLIILWLAFAV